jgi:hypothetical protein
MTDQTAYTEVLARLLCAADVHVHGDDHPTWQQLVGEPGSRIRDDYRKAARWLAARLTVTDQPPAAPAVQAPATDRAAVLREAADMADGLKSPKVADFLRGMAEQADLHRMADEAQPAETERHRPVALATPCANLPAACTHPYNWHASHGACEAADCPCRTFVPGERPEPVDPRRILGADPDFAAGAQQPKKA